MKYKDILVYLDDGASNKDRVQTALSFAAAHDAHLVGVTFDIKIPPHVSATLTAKINKEQQENSSRKAQSIIDDFLQQASETDVKVDTHILHCRESKAPEALSLYARNFDITILRQTNPDRTHSAPLVTSLAEKVLFSSGRPVLYVPYVGAHQIPANRAIIAWDGSRASTRAVHDALPLMEGMDEVIVLVVNADKKPSSKGKDAGEELVTHLKRHGLNARLEHVQSMGVDVAIIVLNALADLGADILIMGGYGSSRIHEMFLGGVTKTLMRDMTIPVFMSH